MINPEVDRTIQGVSVELTNLESLTEDGLAVVSSTYAVDVVVRGKSSEVASLISENFTATADMRNFPKGRHEVEVKVTGPENIEVMEIRPGRIEVEVEELVATNKPIRLRYTQEFPDDMEPGFITVAPQEIEVSGTKTQVDSVAYAEAEIDSMQMNEETRTFKVDVLPMQENGDRVYDVSMSQNTVEITAKLCYVKEVPLNVWIDGEPPSGLAVTKMDMPDTVFIRGEKEAIDGVTFVRSALVDISKLRETTIITPQLNLPKGVELAEASKGLSITIEIGGVEATSFTMSTDKIDIRGVPEGYSAYVNTGNIAVNVYGSHDQIEAFKESDLKLYVDLKNMDLTQSFVDTLVNYEKSDAFKRVDMTPIAVRIAIVQPAAGQVLSPETVTGTESAIEQKQVEESGTDKSEQDQGGDNG
jgi:YbbR domain-containing protein